MIKRKAIAAIMAGLLTIGPGLAACGNNAASSSTASTSASSSTPEWAVVEGDTQAQDATTQAELPAKYDMREKGLVTPVKRQNPWGTCWAFGVTAAVESSILSALDTTYADNKIDLSEKHLAFFGLSPITEGEDPAQAGEGIHLLDENAKPNDIYNSGGNPVFASTLLATGVGPIEETYFPYRGAKGTTTYDYLTSLDKETAIRDFIVPNFEFFTGGTVDEYIASHDDVSTAEEAYEAMYNERVERYSTMNEYYSGDDWTIPERGEDGSFNRWLSHGVVLKNGNILPDMRTEEGRAAAKREMLAGRAVAVSYLSDHSSPSQGEGEYINLDTWAHFSGADDQASLAEHEVCIVGWDDNYPKENFNEKLRPDADGAWLVKNSWGSETDAAADDLGNVVNNTPWGIVDENGKHTGYFWLSYQDGSLAKAETFEFTVGEGWEKGFEALQYDYLPALDRYSYPEQPSEDVVSSANVFEAPRDLTIKSVAAYAPDANTRVTFALYQLNDGATEPTDGELLWRTTKDFDLAGYHRVDVDQGIAIKKGQRFAVVSTASSEGEDGKRVYGTSVGTGATKDGAEAMSELLPQTQYAVTVVNKGESYVYENGAWKDWTDVLAKKDAKEKESGYDFAGYATCDNFGIKVFAEPTE
jgi:hypothetical protein